MEKCNNKGGKSSYFKIVIWHDSCMHSKFPHLIICKGHKCDGPSSASYSAHAYQEFLAIEGYM
jgi:hypothetical protein